MRDHTERGGLLLIYCAMSAMTGLRFRVSQLGGWVSSNRPIFPCFLMHISIYLAQRRTGTPQGSNWYSDMGCSHHKLWFNLLQHNAAAACTFFFFLHQLLIAFHELCVLALCNCHFIRNVIQLFIVTTLEILYSFHWIWLLICCGRLILCSFICYLAKLSLSLQYINKNACTHRSHIIHRISQKR